MEIKKELNDMFKKNFDSIERKNYDHILINTSSNIANQKIKSKKSKKHQD